MLEKIPRLRKNWKSYRHYFSEISVPARTTLLREGEVARKVFFVRQGCLRESVTARGKEVTFQFFFEGEPVASIESFRKGVPSVMTITSVEPSTLLVLQKKGFEVILHDFPELKDILLEIAFKRFQHYAGLFLSFLTATPAQRYRDLLNKEPRIIARVPQRYVASYLGITPVSLSRIRRRI